MADIEQAERRGAQNFPAALRDICKIGRGIATGITFQGVVMEAIPMFVPLQAQANRRAGHPSPPDSNSLPDLQSPAAGFCDPSR